MFPGVRLYFKIFGGRMLGSGILVMKDHQQDEELPPMDLCSAWAPIIIPPVLILSPIPFFTFIKTQFFSLANSSISLSWRRLHQWTFSFQDAWTWVGVWIWVGAFGLWRRFWTLWIIRKTFCMWLVWCIWCVWQLWCQNYCLSIFSSQISRSQNFFSLLFLSYTLSEFNLCQKFATVHLGCLENSHVKNLTVWGFTVKVVWGVFTNQLHHGAHSNITCGSILICWFGTSVKGLSTYLVVINVAVHN